MKKQTLNEQIARIKGMMKMINEQEFDDFDTQITPEEIPYNGDEEFENAQRLASSIIAEVVTRPVEDYTFFDDHSFKNGELYFALTTEAGALNYYFDVDFSSHVSSSPATYHNPSEYSDADYRFTNPILEINDGANVIYKGKDFTDILNVELSSGETVEDILYRDFDEDIQIYSSEYDDEPDWDDYRDMRDGY